MKIRLMYLTVLLALALCAAAVAEEAVTPQKLCGVEDHPVCSCQNCGVDGLYCFEREEPCTEGNCICAAHRLCEGCGSAVCNGQLHAIAACGHCIVSEGEHQTCVGCGAFACNGGNHERLSCGHTACNTTQDHSSCSGNAAGGIHSTQPHGGAHHNSGGKTDGHHSHGSHGHRR